MLELLIAIALLVVLTTLYWGGKKSNRKGRGLANCRLNLEKTFIAFQIYANDFNGVFPVKPGATTSEEPLDLLVPKYTADTSLFICPGTERVPFPGGEPLTKNKISYAYYMGRRATDTSEVLLSDAQVDLLAKAAGQNIFSPNGDPPGNNHGQAGGNFLFGDGRVESNPVRAPFPIALPQGVVLLNPKP